MANRPVLGRLWLYPEQESQVPRLLRDITVRPGERQTPLLSRQLSWKPRRSPAGLPSAGFGLPTKARRSNYKNLWPGYQMAIPLLAALQLTKHRLQGGFFAFHALLS